MGGTPNRPTTKEVDTGEGLVGMTFYACVGGGGEAPVQYIVTTVGDPAAYAGLYKGPAPPFLRYFRTGELGGALQPCQGAPLQRGFAVG